MTLQKLQFRPGIVRDTTDYTNEGGWRDGDKIRFRLGSPRNYWWLDSVYKQQLCWAPAVIYIIGPLLDGTNFISAGTNLKLYVLDGNVPIDITPIRAATSAGDVTFAATNGSKTITVADTNNEVYF